MVSPSQCPNSARELKFGRFLSRFLKYPGGPVSAIVVALVYTSTQVFSNQPSCFDFRIHPATDSLRSNVNALQFQHPGNLLRAPTGVVQTKHIFPDFFADPWLLRILTMLFSQLLRSFAIIAPSTIAVTPLQFSSDCAYQPPKFFNCRFIRTSSLR